MVKINRGNSWEAHKGAAYDFKMNPSDKTIKESDMTIIIIMEMVSTIMMTLRLKQISQDKGMDFNFEPIQDSEYFPRKRKDFKDASIDEILDDLKFGLETDMSDSGLAVPRMSRTIKRQENDDEGRCECVMEDYFNGINKIAAKNKRFKKKVGKIFAAAMMFLARNGLECKVYAWSRSQAPSFKDEMKKEEKEAILNREIFPNFRIGLFTIIGAYENKMDKDFMEDDVETTLNRLFIEENDAYKVKIKKNSEITA